MTMRADIWRKHLIGNDYQIYLKRKLYYNSVSLFPHAVPKEVQDIISKDIPRTNILGADTDNEKIEALLHQYATVMPCDSYIQGFAYLMLVLYHVYSENDKEHAMADTFWSFGTIVSIIRPGIPGHDPDDFHKYTAVWKQHYIDNVRINHFLTHRWLTSFYDVLLPSISVKWLMVWFTQQFKLKELLIVWDSIICCDPAKRTKLLAIIAANITLQNKDNIAYWAEHCPSEIGPRLMCAGAKDAKIIVEMSRNAMLEYKLPF